MADVRVLGLWEVVNNPTRTSRRSARSGASAVCREKVVSLIKRLAQASRERLVRISRLSWS